MTADAPGPRGLDDDLTADDLTVDYLGELIRCRPDRDLTFGRRADLSLDDNPFMHRVVGRFVHREGIWWLQNHGSSARLRLRDLDHDGEVEASPGQQYPIVGMRFAVQFLAGPTRYELLGTRRVPPPGVDRSVTDSGTETMAFGAVPLSPDQHLLLVALYESAIRGNGAIEGNAVIARRLGWTPKKFHRKLDAICDKLARQGVRGVKGDLGAAADLRRNNVVDHALNAGLIGPGDLGLLVADRTA